jgi:hypothetical protein
MTKNEIKTKVKQINKENEFNIQILNFRDPLLRVIKGKQNTILTRDSSLGFLNGDYSEFDKNMEPGTIKQFEIEPGVNAIHFTGPQIIKIFQPAPELFDTEITTLNNILIKWAPKYIRSEKVGEFIKDNDWTKVVSLRRLTLKDKIGEYIVYIGKTSSGSYLHYSHDCELPMAAFRDYSNFEQMRWEYEYPYDLENWF